MNGERDRMSEGAREKERWGEGERYIERQRYIERRGRERESRERERKRERERERDERERDYHNFLFPYLGAFTSTGMDTMQNGLTILVFIPKDTHNEE